MEDLSIRHTGTNERVFWAQCSAYHLLTKEPLTLIAIAAPRFSLLFVPWNNQSTWWRCVDPMSGCRRMCAGFDENDMHVDGKRMLHGLSGSVSMAMGAVIAEVVGCILTGYGSNAPLGKSKEKDASARSRLLWRRYYRSELVALLVEAIGYLPTRLAHAPSLSCGFCDRRIPRIVFLVKFYAILTPLFRIFSLICFFRLTAKEHLRAQQHAQGSRQRHQEEEAHEVRFDKGYGPQVLEEPEIFQEVQQIEASCWGVKQASFWGFSLKE